MQAKAKASHASWVVEALRPQPLQGGLPARQHSPRPAQAVQQCLELQAATQQQLQRLVQSALHTLRSLWLTRQQLATLDCTASRNADLETCSHRQQWALELIVMSASQWQHNQSVCCPKRASCSSAGSAFGFVSWSWGTVSTVHPIQRRAAARRAAMVPS